MGELAPHPFQLEVWMHDRQAVAVQSRDEMIRVFEASGQPSARREARLLCGACEHPHDFYAEIVKHARRRPGAIHAWGIAGQPLCLTCALRRRT